MIAAFPWMVAILAALYGIGATFTIDRAAKREAKLRNELALANASRQYWIAACERLQKLREEFLDAAAHLADLHAGSAEAWVNLVDCTASVPDEAHHALFRKSRLITAGDKGNTEAVEA